MPLTNSVIIGLNEITTMVADKERLDEKEAEMARDVFKDILKRGERYDVEDVGSWLENEGTWKNRAVRVRITNLAHYVQSRHDQAATLRVVNDAQDQCSDGSCSCGS